MKLKLGLLNLERKLLAMLPISLFSSVYFAEELGLLILGDLTGGNTIGDVAFVIRCVSFAILVIPHLSVTKGYLQGHNYITPPSNSNLIEQIVRILLF